MSNGQLTQRKQKKNAVFFCAAVLLRKCFWVFPLLLLAQLALVDFVRDARASEASADGGTGSDWKFSVSPYFWAAGISGTTSSLSGLPPVEFDESFSDIWDDLQFAGMIAGTARKGRFGFAGDLQYVETEAKSNSLDPLFSGEKFVSKTFLVSLLGDYIAFEKGRSIVALSAGARLWSVDTELELSPGILRGRKLTSGDTWVDPVVGVRGTLDVGANVFLSGWGYVGGFGVGSDMMADLFGGVGYRFSELISATVGYRWMKVDRESSSFLYDVEQEGVLAGLTFSF